MGEETVNAGGIGITTVDAAPKANLAVDAGSPASLVIVRSPDAALVGRVLPVADPVVLGRDVQGGGLSVNDPRMSRTHFRVVFDRRSNAPRIGDARSRNGTYVNRKKIESTVLVPGDVIRAADTLLVYGDPAPMESLTRRVALLAQSTLSAVILGETGSGKERVARALHEQSGRSGRLLAVNCAALPKELLSAELFGHTKGAFSGAAQARSGLFVAANEGTLFLDEVAELPFELQAILLRALEERVVRPVGSDKEVPVDVRVIAATHVDIRSAVEDKKFRGDLYARLAQTVIEVPPLRNRRTELLALLNALAASTARGLVAITAEAAEMLLSWHWPFNVRELESLVLAHATLSKSPELDAAYLLAYHPEIARTDDQEATANDADPADPPRVSRVELEALFRRHKGNVSEVAKELGKQRVQVYRWSKSLGLAPEKFR